MILMTAFSFVGTFLLLFVKGSSYLKHRKFTKDLARDAPALVDSQVLIWEVDSLSSLKYMKKRERL